MKNEETKKNMIILHDNISGYKMTEEERIMEMRCKTDTETFMMLI